jgi:hypothetical protein
LQLWSLFPWSQVAIAASVSHTYMAFQTGKKLEQLSLCGHLRVGRTSQETPHRSHWPELDRMPNPRPMIVRWKYLASFSVCPYIRRYLFLTWSLVGREREELPWMQARSCVHHAHIFPVTFSFLSTPTHYHYQHLDYKRQPYSTAFSVPKYHDLYGFWAIAHNFCCALNIPFSLIY